MKKKLDTTGVMNELRGQSVFFPTKADKSTPEQSAEPIENKEFASKLANKQTDKEVNKQVSNPASLQTSNQTSSHDSKHASTLAAQPDIIEIIRKIVKTPAKEEVLYVRLTKEEKNQLGDIEYTYGRQDIETSGNELGRIAVNFLIADYQTNGVNSI